jgi:3-oxoadipate enol-lactonase
MVGAGGNDSDWGIVLVDRVPKRLVLKRGASVLTHCVSFRSIFRKTNSMIRRLVAIAAASTAICVSGLAQAVPAGKTVAGHLEISGSKIYYEECGTGSEAVLLLHDGLLHSVTWDAIWKPLCRKYHAIRYDRRGYGRSESPKTPFAPTDDMFAVLSHLRVERAVLVGSSSGAALAIDFTLTHPESVEGLFLIGPVVHGTNFTEEFVDRGQKNNAPLENGDTKSAAENWSRDHYLIGEGHEAARKQVLEILTDNPQNLKHNGEFEIQTSPAASSRLAEIHVPTSIVVGEFDINDVHAQAGAIESGIGGSERDIIINAGHLVQIEQPEILMEKLAPFIELQERKSVEVALGTLRSYVGRYNAGRGVITIGMDEGHLTMQGPGQAAFALFAESQTRFFLRVAETEIEFMKDASGQVNRAILRQDGETIKAPRM